MPAIKLTGSGSTFTCSDHYPIVGDYNIVVPAPTAPAAPKLTTQGLVGGNFQLKFSSSTNIAFSIQASTILTNWTTVGSATTDGTGSATFQDTNAALFPMRLYRAIWSAP